MRRIFYALNPACPKTPLLRQYLFAEFLEKSRAWKSLSKKWPTGIFGSYAGGTFDRHSDLDVWVYSDNNDLIDIRKHVDALAKELRCEGNIVFLNKDHISKLKTSDPEFYYRLKLLSWTDRPEVFNVA